MKSRTIVSTFFLATLAIGTILVSTKTGANVVTDNVSLAIPVSCSMSSTINSGNEHTDSVMPGTYTKDIGTTNIKVICNDFSGFSIYAIGYTNNTEGNNTMLGTNTNQTIITGTNTSGNTSNWAMKLIKVENGTGGDITYNPGNLSILNGYNAYHAVPDTLTKVAEYKATTGSSTTDQTLGSNIQTTYAAFISGAQAPDTYVGKVKYILIHPATLIAGNYSIAYYAAGGSGTMNTETNIKNYEPHTLATNTFTAPAGGYTFKEWCTVQDTNATPSSPQTTCDGTSYDPGATIPVSTISAGNTLNLYAVWKAPMTFNEAYAEAGKSKYGSTNYYAMQDMTPDICTNVADGQVGTLIDIRGTTQTYTVAKLADGKCWMTENLNIAGGTALSADDTDVTSTYISGFTNQANLTKSGNTITLPASATAGFNNDSNAFVYNSGNKTNCGASGQNTPCYSYYSWIAATLGGKQANGATAIADYYNAAASICPKGWKLPTSTTSNANAQTSPNWKTGDWYALARAYGANLESNYYDSSTGKNFYNNAGPVNNSIPNFLLAGYYNPGSFYLGGSYGYYWSSTSNSSTYAYSLLFYSSLVNSASNDYRRRGFSVRCLAAPSS